jgi:hypothetical protein
MPRPLPLLAAALSGALLFHLTGALAQNERRPRDPGLSVRVFEGTSDRGELQEALDDATRRALRSLPGADRTVDYRVREISGQAGGIRGVGTLKVAIEVVDDAPAPPRDRPEVGALDDEKLQETLRRAVKTTVRVPKEIERGEAVALELVLVNTSEDTVRIPLDTGQKFDFEVWRDNRQIWKWSTGRFFTQALGTIVIQPDEEVTFRTTWDQRNADGIRVPAGAYQVRGYVPTKWTEFRIGSTSPLTITGR